MLIRELALAVERRWRAHSYGEHALPAVAAECLAAAALHRNLDLAGILDHVFDPDAIDPRPHNPCDDVAVLFRGPRFEICAHLWLDAVVEPHHHTWAGAYQLVTGSSVHGRYRFREERRVQCGLRTGELACAGVELQRAGDVVEVAPGSAWIHALAYNERPSVAVSVRAVNRPEQIRMQYWRPGVAIEAEGPDAPALLCRKLLRFVSGFDREACRRRLLDWLRFADARTAYHALGFARLELGDEPLWREAADAARRTHGAWFDTVIAALDDAAAHLEQRALRATIADPDLRLLLSALYMCPDRASVLALVRARVGGDPEDALRAWLRALLAPDSPLARRTLGPSWDEALGELACALASEVPDGGAVARVAEQLAVEDDAGADAGELVAEVYTVLRSHRVLAPLFCP